MTTTVIDALFFKLSKCVRHVRSRTSPEQNRIGKNSSLHHLRHDRRVDFSPSEQGCCAVYTRVALLAPGPRITEIIIRSLSIHQQPVTFGRKSDSRATGAGNIHRVDKIITPSAQLIRVPRATSTFLLPNCFAEPLQYSKIIRYYRRRNIKLYVYNIS